MHSFQKLVRSVTAQLYVTALLRCLLVGLTAYFLVRIFTNDTYAIGIAALAGAGAAWQSGFWRNKKNDAILLIHRYQSDSEYSLHLLEKPELNVAEQLQMERLDASAAAFPYAKIYLPLRGYAFALLTALVMLVAIPFMKSAATNVGEKINAGHRTAVTEPVLPLRFQSATVKVQPPAYTRLPARETDDLNISAVAGSRLEWRVYFKNDRDVTVKLAGNRGEEIDFIKNKESYVYADKLTGSGLYSIKAYRADSLAYQSEFFKAEALADLAPGIEPASRELYKYHFLKDKKTIEVAAKISDDFEVARAFIVATVARGSGENVKFREVRFPLDAHFKSKNLKKTIDLNALNFAPGDELYYYWAAVDNREPEPNFSKSDTYFLVYKDTSNIAEAELATMAVNMMPEYFRSQRQIIIDTEKLLAKRKKLSKQAFNETSNEIGFDQKVLRLRYGQYLGEEFETNIGGGNHDDGNVVDAFTHHSDGAGEGAENRAAEPETHHHQHESAAKDHEKDPLAALMEQYTHSHDDAETNTFYEQSTRSLLKMALEQMWQSELYLRTYDPQKALPFEYKALEYLKTAQQKARTYAKKTGYDPPPIKEQEKRLTGEMKEMTDALKAQQFFNDKKTSVLAAEMLGLLEYKQWNAAQKGSLQQLGKELSQRTAEKSGLQNWTMLTALQKLIAQKTLSSRELSGLRVELSRLAGRSELRAPGYSGGEKLEDAFKKRLR